MQNICLGFRCTTAYGHPLQQLSQAQGVIGLLRHHKILGSGPRHAELPLCLSMRSSRAEQVLKVK